MSFRSFLWLGWLACAVSACDGTLPAPLAATAALPPEAAPETAKLSIASDQSVSVVARDQVVLQVRYTDLDGEPRQFEEVSFGLSGSAEGASLGTAVAITDADGYAETTLKAGGTVAAFQVRASAAGAWPTYFDVRVVQAARPALTVRVSYQGERILASHRIAIVSNMTCEQLGASSSEAFRVSYVLGAEEETLEYPDMLGAGSRYVAFAWGSDDTNSTLATGCAPFTPRVTEQKDEAAFEITVQLRDLPFTLAPAYDVTLIPDLTRPLTSLATRARARAEAALPKTSTPEASFLLDRLAEQLNFSAARASLGLDAALAARLTQRQTGPLRTVEALTRAVTSEALNSSFEGQLTPAADGTASRFEITRLVSMRGGMSARDVSLSVLRGPAQLAAPYNDARAALVVEALTIPLRFGELALDLLAAVQTLPDAQGVLPAARNGCAELKGLVADNAAAFPGLSTTQVDMLCVSGMDTLLSDVRADWSSLDATSAALQLNGPVYVHDRDGDAVVDDLGPSPLTGSFSGGLGAETPVSATLRVTPKSTLAI